MVVDLRGHGHDNARRTVETGVGMRLDRAAWTASDLTAAMTSLLGDEAMRKRLKDNSARMMAAPGAARAADAILTIVGR